MNVKMRQRECKTKKRKKMKQKKFKNFQFTLFTIRINNTHGNPDKTGEREREGVKKGGGRRKKK